MASHGEVVLLGPAEVVLEGAGLAAGSHVLAAVNIPETVQDHGVEKLSVAESIALACFGEQVRGAGHAFQATGHDQRRVAGANRLVGEHDGLESRAAHLVDRERPDGIGQAAEDRCLAGWILTQAGRDHVAHDDFVDRLRGDPGPFEEGLDAGSAELGGRNARQGTVHGAHGRANSGHDE